MRLDINTNEAIKLTAKLERLHRSALPSAIRNTLNQTAFNAKKEVPKIASNNFTIRQANLFKRSVLVGKASGFNVNTMASKVGIDGSMKTLSDGLEKQETGGNLVGSKLVAHNLSRISSSASKKVKKKNYIQNISNVGTARKRVKGSKYFRIKSTIFERTSAKKITPLYTVKKSRVTRLKAKPFIYPSALIASRSMNDEFQKQAEFQIRKYTK